ncbi:hypothetical protein [Maridesulfovibrio hydrothermalis]|uniref:Capsule polysaccharide biosynthesis protein n=1 Tax=Maridesulfovibrio hydrothermalis AM13 = DSM 14728 TaxID=1121451 RepID=L0RAK8_9BACT|nr:hypothetical protein [Maridesulfovibrio hydrothermalis]CCO23225.1 protein of unknown function [Maridesulfovibrio hydrothermalis AM13 = DSM 14728]
MGKEAVLLISRGYYFPEYIQGMIEVFHKDYEVLVIEPNPEIKFTGRHTRLKPMIKSNLELEKLYQKVNQIENETGLNLYESYSNYFYYGRLAEEANICSTSYWKSKEELSREFVGAYNIVERITREHDLKFCFHDTIDLILLQMVEAFSKIRNFGFYHTLIRLGAFDERVLLTCGMSRKSPLFYKNLKENKPLSIEENKFITKTINDFSKEKKVPQYLQKKTGSLISLSELKKLPLKIKNMKYGLKRILNRMYLNKVTRNFTHNSVGDYILFFLHHQPESTTTSAAQGYVDQWKIVEDIAVNAPLDLNIIVKGHPWSFGWHGKNYFKKLIRLPNVHLAPAFYPGKELIKDAKIVLTINGSVGIEALIYNTPVYTVGNPWYSDPEYIENLDNHLDILNRWENPKQISEQKRNRFLAAVYKSSFYSTNLNGPKFYKEKIESGHKIAEHVLAHKDIYFRRMDQ